MATTPPTVALQAPKPKSKKSRAAFKSKHALQFGLKVSHRDPDTSAVTSCVCRFCSVFGRETDTASVGESGKRRKTTRLHHYSTFRTDLYQQHLTIAHGKKWEAYQRLTTDIEREAFFTIEVPLQGTLHAHFSIVEQHLTIKLSAAIVEDVIGKLLFHPDDAEGLTRQRALSLFTSTDDGGYMVVVKAPKRFSILVETIALGASFRMAARIVQHVRDETNLAVYSGCTDTLASNYTRVVCASALQELSNLLALVTGFSLAFDSSTLHSHSYLDIRVRLVVHGCLYNFHLIALPLFGSHTGKHMCDALVSLHDAVCSSWRNVLVGIATDGEPKMTGRVRGLATLIENKTATAKLIRVWCGLHQLDLVMQRVYKSSLRGDFLATLMAAIGHLRRQQLLIAQMRSTCPKVADTRWLSMLACTSWFTRNMVVVQDHYDARTTQHSSKPDKAWWIFLYAVDALAQEASTAFTRLQGQQSLISQQRVVLSALADTYMTMSGMVGPLTDEGIHQVVQDEREKVVMCGRYGVSHASAEALLVELDMWIGSALAELQVEIKDVLVASVAEMFARAASEIRSIVAERGSDNSATSELLPPFLVIS